jgi:hypothetical protein
MDRITDLLPAPVVVRMAGVDYSVHEIRLSDIRDLQAFLDASVPNPFDAVMAEIAAPGVDAERRRTLLAAAYDSAETGSPVDGTDRADAAFATAEGRVFELWVALRRGQPGVPIGTLVDAARTDRPGVARVLRAFYRVDPCRAIAQMLRTIPAVKADSGGSSWVKAIDELSRERNWTYEYIYSLTATEFGFARTHGAKRSVEFELPADNDAALAFAREQRRQYYGDGPPARVESYDGRSD